MSDGVASLTDVIAIMRAGGVTQAEFYETGAVKLVALGPTQSAAQPGDDEPPEDRPMHPLKRAAMGLMGKEPPADA